MSHIGGSIGLMMRGIDLQRDLKSSDLDITVDQFAMDDSKVSDLYESSDASDFDIRLIKQSKDSDRYVKIDLRIDPEPEFDTIIFNDRQYNVSKLEDILKWKSTYAEKGFAKHKDDLVVISTGVRPIVEFVGDELGF